MLNFRRFLMDATAVRRLGLLIAPPLLFARDRGRTTTRGRTEHLRGCARYSDRYEWSGHPRRRSIDYQYEYRHHHNGNDG